MAGYGPCRALLTAILVIRHQGSGWGTGSADPVPGTLEFRSLDPVFRSLDLYLGSWNPVFRSLEAILGSLEAISGHIGYI